MNGSASVVSHSTYWSEHAEAWGHLADVEAEYVGDLAMEDFYAELSEAAHYLTRTHFHH